MLGGDLFEAGYRRLRRVTHAQPQLDAAEVLRCVALDQHVIGQRVLGVVGRQGSIIGRVFGVLPDTLGRSSAEADDELVQRGGRKPRHLGELHDELAARTKLAHVERDGQTLAPVVAYAPQGVHRALLVALILRQPWREQVRQHYADGGVHREQRQERLEALEPPERETGIAGQRAQRDGVAVTHDLGEVGAAARIVQHQPACEFDILG